MFAYSNNGLSFRAVDDDYVAQTGEVLFPDYATSDELKTAFTGYVAPLSEAALLLQAQALSALAVTDNVFIRCGKAGGAWPAEWQSYVLALRAIVANPASATALPVAPAYPAGS